MKLTNDSKRQIRPIQQRPLLILTHHILTHMQQLEATRRSAHKGNRPKRQPSKLSRPRSRLARSQLIDEIRCERQLHEPFDVEKDVEPGLVGFLGEERVAGGRDVPGAQGEEEV